MKKYRVWEWLCMAVIMVLCSAIFFPPGISSAEEQIKEPSAGLTEEEREFVKRKGTITIGCRVDERPLVFQEEKTGEIQGITIDILDMVSEAVGLKFQYQTLPEGSVTYEELQQMQVDMVASVEHNEINKKSPNIVMTDPYLQAEKVFVCKKGFLFDPDGEMAVAVSSGSQTLSKVIQQAYPQFQVEFYDSTEDALSALLSGEADAVLQNQYIIERILAKPMYENLQIVASASIGDSHCLAGLAAINEDGQSMISDETALMVSVLNKGIAGLDKRRVSFVIIKEATENVYKLTVRDMLYRYGYAIAVIALSFFLIVFLLWRNHILQMKRSEQLAAEQRARELAAVNEHMHEQQILLKDALERAEAGSRAKTSFLFNMSHDIRTPMNAILGFAAIAYNHRDDRDKLTDSLEKIQLSGNHLLQLINQILDMTKIESGKVTLTEDACNLVEIIRGASDILQAEMSKKNLSVRMDVSGVKDELIYCDNLWMSQILFNLLSNAVKFSKTDGIIYITLNQEQSDRKDYAGYELRVKDTGIGMAPDFIPRIFEPFERERTSTVSKTQGTGLGMSITKNIVDLMDGTIEVYSELDKGTEFVLHFTFKLQTDVKKSKENAEEETLPAMEFSGRRLLLVEDNELNMEIAEEILCEEGFLVETAEDGKIAVEMVQKSAPGYYDAVLMDIQMPVMDGYQATREIRKLKTKELAEIPIIALTANTFDKDKREAFAAGMNAHTAKPIDIDVLCRVLEEVLGEQSGQPVVGRIR